MTPTPRLRPASLAVLAATLAALLPALTLAQGLVPMQEPPPPAASGAWPLGLIVLGVAVVFVAGWLVSRRGRGPGGRAGRTA